MTDPRLTFKRNCLVACVRAALAVGLAISAMAGIGSASAQTSAQDYPTRPVRWVVGFAAGGSTDILARVLSEWMQVRLGQAFLVENKPGAGSNIATETVVGSPP